MLEGFDGRRYLIPFRSLLLPHIFTDTLVIGAGVAGMRAAIAAAAQGSDVIVLHKSPLTESSTAWAQGGVAAAIGRDDSPTLHLEDTLDVGAGLCDEPAVRLLCAHGPGAIEELLAWGMQPDLGPQGQVDLGREGGHRRHRVVHAGGAATGAAVVDCLWERLRHRPMVRVFDRCFALDLLTTEHRGGDSGDGARVLGAITHHPRYGLQIIWAKATILAGGGAGQVYRETTNPRAMTGDALAMAYRAGAVLADLEFMQFHPTTLYVAGSARSLISEAVRGEGAHLVDRAGRRFMLEYDDRAELAPRDLVSRVIHEHLNRTQESAVFLDARHFPRGRFAERFPDLHELLHGFDLDPETDLIPVHPSAHYTIGGVAVDLGGRTSLPGLYACGEAACTGIHGANRLASNSLLEGLVFGQRAGEAVAEAREVVSAPLQIVSEIATTEHGELDIGDVRASLRSVMWRNVGIERTGAKLRDVEDMFSFWARYAMPTVFDDPAGWETQNLLVVGALITRAARWREESRGVHYRQDHPEPRDEFRVHAQWRAGVGAPTLQPQPPAPAAEPAAPAGAAGKG